MNWIHTFLFLLISSSIFSQIISPARSVDWTLAGLRDTTTAGFVEIDMEAQGVIGDGLTPNDSILESVLRSNVAPGVILTFPAGNYLFNSTIEIPSNVIIKGEGAEHTTFTIDLDGSGHAISIQGSRISSDTTSITSPARKASDTLSVSNADIFSQGDWVQIVQHDTNFITSSWAENTVGQITKIRSIEGNKIRLESPLRMDYDTFLSPYIVKIDPVENAGIECLKIHRIDDTAPEQASNVAFSYAANCWVTGIESENCTFSHVEANHASNLYISKSYFHHAFSYGGGGRAYGVMLQATSNECLIENNIFEHLRHAMILQSGANGNVFAYNYSRDPYWDIAPNDAAGDMVLHGNYPYANLFEQNIGANIIIDNSHGPNGPYNTIFRNRAELFGIFFSASNSPGQNIVGNEIPNTTSPYRLVNYTIQGDDHFVYGNNNKGVIEPTGTDVLLDTSYAYLKRPNFIPLSQWAGIGTPNDMNSTTIPAYDRYHSGEIFSNACGDIPLNNTEVDASNVDLLIYPNPVSYEVAIESAFPINTLKVFNVIGQEVYNKKITGLSATINTCGWDDGVYFLLIHFSKNHSTTKILVKTSY